MGQSFPGRGYWLDVEWEERGGARTLPRCLAWASEWLMAAVTVKGAQKEGLLEQRQAQQRWFWVYSLCRTSKVTCLEGPSIYRAWHIGGAKEIAVKWTVMLGKSTGRSLRVEMVIWETWTPTKEIVRRHCIICMSVCTFTRNFSSLLSSFAFCFHISGIEEH